MPHILSTFSRDANENCGNLSGVVFNSISRSIRYIVASPCRAAALSAASRLISYRSKNGMAMNDYLALILGVACAGIGGELFVRGAVGLAHWARISPGIIGATVVAFATTGESICMHRRISDHGILNNLFVNEA